LAPVCRTALFEYNYVLKLIGLTGRMTVPHVVQPTLIDAKMLFETIKMTATKHMCCLIVAVLLSLTCLHLHV